MRRYIALLRGVNISGKNKVPMAELKLGFESLGFSDVRTWLNSGNVVFSGEEMEPAALTGQIEGMIQRRFGLEIPVFVLPQEELADTLRHAPDWWGTEDPEVYDNLISSCRPLLFRTSIARSARRRRAWSRSGTTGPPCSGPSTGRSIRKRTGGRKRPARRSPRS